MSAAGAERAPVVSMRALLAAGAAATAVSTPPGRADRAPAPQGEAAPAGPHAQQAAPESEAA
ncbi:hypothetical protein Slala03_01020 [Streptomyces lavendulae subsp. lavendulae]|uniref:hypothetical protein n=1 Tax=Streptomyces lavendulae TaxID=1914 RepID=UPI0024A0E6F4|nr:hypothetical protein [Streptomyces lavendulae]GLV80413.1 hypothetical protein Slala03_01020 [Streptomyces lavendulae subsp. lavendulae]GLX39166.1 hypothetical protein Sros01_52390 [Streptomyces roseochromogenus]